MRRVHPRVHRSGIHAGAWISGRERIRLQRMQRHLLVAGAATAALVYLLSTNDTLLEVALVPLFVAIALQSAARGLSAGFGYLWGWPYPEPTTSTRLDRWAGGLLLRLTRPPDSEKPASDERIRILDPWESD